MVQSLRGNQTNGRDCSAQMDCMLESCSRSRPLRCRAVSGFREGEDDTPMLPPPFLSPPHPRLNSPAPFAHSALGSTLAFLGSFSPGQIGQPFRCVLASVWTDAMESLECDEVAHQHEQADLYMGSRTPQPWNRRSLRCAFMSPKARSTIAPHLERGFARSVSVF